MFMASPLQSRRPEVKSHIVPKDCSLMIHWGKKDKDIFFILRIVWYFSQSVIVKHSLAHMQIEQIPGGCNHLSYP